MPSITSLASSPFAAGRPTGLNQWAGRVAVVILGSSLLWASAKIQVPFWPVPMTIQTYVVLMLGALFGWRLGAATMITYLAEGALGLPVFAGTPANGIGLAYMAGPTGGYLAGYVVAVVVVGMLAARGWTRSALRSTATLLVGELAILGLGCGWLAVQFGWNKAFALGVAPFLAGDALKLILAVATVFYVGRQAVQE